MSCIYPNSHWCTHPTYSYGNSWPSHYTPRYYEFPSVANTAPRVCYPCSSPTPTKLNAYITPSRRERSSYDAEYASRLQPHVLHRHSGSHERCRPQPASGIYFEPEYRYRKSDRQTYLTSSSSSPKRCHVSFNHHYLAHSPEIIHVNMQSSSPRQHNYREPNRYRMRDGDYELDRKNLEYWSKQAFQARDSPENKLIPTRKVKSSLKQQSTEQPLTHKKHVAFSPDYAGPAYRHNKEISARAKIYDSRQRC